MLAFTQADCYAYIRILIFINLALVKSKGIDCLKEKKLTAVTSEYVSMSRVKALNNAIVAFLKTNDARPIIFPVLQSFVPYMSYSCTTSTKYILYNLFMGQYQTQNTRGHGRIRKHIVSVTRAIVTQ